MPLFTLSERMQNNIDPFFFLCSAYMAAIPAFLSNLLSLFTLPLGFSSPKNSTSPPTLYPSPTKATPGNLLTNLYDLLFYHTWVTVAHRVDERTAIRKAPLLASCSGTVLEIGAGVGNNIKYFQRSQIKQLIVVEPNAFMHAALRENARASGFTETDGSLVVLGCGGDAKHEATVVSALGGSEGVLDAVVCVHVLCSIADVAAAVEMYRRLLRSEGRLVFYEHVQARERSTVWWQVFYEKFGWCWLMGGCHLTKKTAEIIEGRMMLQDRRWKDFKVESPVGDSKWACIPTRYGYAIKP